jgi:TonB family protein
MTHYRNKNLSSLLMIAVVLSLSAISCKRLAQLTGYTQQSDKVRRLNCGLPAGANNSERYSGVNPHAMLIILPDSEQIVLGNADADPIDVASLANAVDTFMADKSPDQRVASIAAVRDVDADAIARVLDVLRERVNSVYLLTRSRAEPDGDKCIDQISDVVGADGSLEVKLKGRDDSVMGRPNPLTLAVTVANGKPRLNNETLENEEKLATLLADVFRQREENGVFRESSNEVEKTVYLSMKDGDSSPKYGDIVRMVNTLKGAGSSPIILSEPPAFGMDVREARDLPPATSHGPTDLDKTISPDSLGPVELDEPPPPPPRPENTPPKIVSGGVLNGKAIDLPKPAYPPAARAADAKGTVNVQVTLDIDGKVISASAVSGHPLLRAAAVQAARSAKFPPTKLSGQPVKVTGVIVYNFVP